MDGVVCAGRTAGETFWGMTARQPVPEGQGTPAAVPVLGEPFLRGWIRTSGVDCFHDR